MVKPTLRSWLWLGVAGVALTCGMHAPAKAQIFIGGSGKSVETITASDYQLPQQFTFSEFTGSHLLMPNPNLSKMPRLHLKDPSAANTIKLIAPGTKPAGGYKLIIPQESETISLTPPPGTKIYLTPPRTKAKKVATTKAKAKPAPKPVKMAQKPEPQPVAPQHQEQSVAVAPAAPVVKDIDPVTKPDTKPQAAIIEAPVLAKAKTDTAAVKTVATTKAPVIETPEPPPAPAKVVAVPTPPAIEAPKVEAPEIEAPKVEAPKIEPMAPQVAAVPAPKVEKAAPQASKPEPATGDNTTVALLFAQDDARLNDDHRALIKGVITQLEAKPNSAVQLMAYAVANDRSKSRRLSLSRALAVRSYLLKHEIRNTRIQVRAMGDQVKSGKPDRVDLILTTP